MEGADEEKSKRFLMAFVACQIYLSIDDLHLNVQFRTSREHLTRFYPIDHIPTEILRELHRDDHIV